MLKRVGKEGLGWAKTTHLLCLALFVCRKGLPDTGLTPRTNGPGGLVSLVVLVGRPTSSTIHRWKKVLEQDQDSANSLARSASRMSRDEVVPMRVAPN